MPIKFNLLEALLVMEEQLQQNSAPRAAQNRIKALKTVRNRFLVPFNNLRRSES